MTFTHESGAPSYKVPGYFAADGNAGESSAEAGTKWRAHLAPDKPGTWAYSVSFTRGKHAALGSVRSVTGGAKAALGTPPADATEDWLVVVRK